MARELNCRSGETLLELPELTSDNGVSVVRGLMVALHFTPVVLFSTLRCPRN